MLDDVERELRAARWDRRLARAAVVLLVVGVGMNAALVLIESRTHVIASGQIAGDRNAEFADRNGDRRRRSHRRRNGPAVCPADRRLERPGTHRPEVAAIDAAKRQTRIKHAILAHQTLLETTGHRSWRSRRARTDRQRLHGLVDRANCKPKSLQSALPAIPRRSPTWPPSRFLRTRMRPRILETTHPRLDQFAKEHAHFWTTPLGQGYDQRRRSRRAATTEQIDAIRTIIDKYPDIDAGLAAAAACDHTHRWRTTPLITNSSSTTSAKSACHNPHRRRFIGLANGSADRDGQADEAVGVGIELLRLARHYESEPLLVNYLVAIAVRAHRDPTLYDGLAAGPVPPEMHAALEKELAQHDILTNVRVLKTERAIASSERRVESGWPCKKARSTLWLARVWPMKSLFLTPSDCSTSNSSGGPTLSQTRDRSEAVSVTTSGMAQWMTSSCPRLQATYEANRELGYDASLRIFNALAQYRDEHGREASGLDDLSLPSGGDD